MRSWPGALRRWRRIRPQRGRRPSRRDARIVALGRLRRGRARRRRSARAGRDVHGTRPRRRLAGGRPAVGRASVSPRRAAVVRAPADGVGREDLDVATAPWRGASSRRGDPARPGRLRRSGRCAPARGAAGFGLIRGRGAPVRRAQGGRQRRRRERGTDAAAGARRAAGGRAYPDVLGELGEAELSAGLPQAGARIEAAIGATEDPARRRQLSLRAPRRCTPTVATATPPRRSPCR